MNITSTTKKTTNSKKTDVPAMRSEPEKQAVQEKIDELLSHREPFSLDANMLVKIHHTLFSGLCDFAGQLRHVNLKKRESVLHGKSVKYCGANQIAENLERVCAEERERPRPQPASAGFIPRIARFVARLWRIHPFREGNTRTVAIFTVLYLRSLGLFHIGNEYFKEHASRFRRSLVMASRSDNKMGIRNDYQHLVHFLSRVLRQRGRRMRFAMSC